MKKLFYNLKNIWREIVFIFKHDPIKHCEVYKTKGCAHVDGPLCNYPNCDMGIKESNEDE